MRNPFNKKLKPLGPGLIQPGGLITPPVPVLGTPVVISDTQINIPVTSDYPYEMWYSDDNGATYTKHGDGSATPYEATGLTAGTLYYFEARGVNGSKYSDYSSAVSAWTILPLTRNSDIVISGGYTDIVTVPNLNGTASAVRSRLWFSNSHQNRIRNSGNLHSIQMHIGGIINISELWFQVWRNDGGLYDLIAQENITASLIANTTITHVFSGTLTVQEGDHIGFYIVDNGTAAASTFAAAILDITNSLYYVNGVYDPTDYNIKGGSSIANPIPCKIYMQAPMLVGIGDSIMAGHNGFYTFVETTDQTSYVYNPLYQLKLLNTNANYQNMAIGAKTSTEIAARFAADVIALKPKIALIEGGIVDLIGGTITKATFLSNMQSMIDACITESIQPVVYKITPWTDGTNEQMQKRDDWMTDLYTLVQSYSERVLWIDFDTALGVFRVGGDEGNLWDINPTYDGDGIHFNQAGYTKIAEIVDGVLNENFILN